MKWRPRRRTLKIGAILCAGCSLLLLLTCVGCWHWFPFPMAQLERWPASPVVTDRTGRTLLQTVGRDDQWRMPVPLDRMSPWLASATVAVEDERYWRHPGIDPIAVCRACCQNLVSRRVVSGASTLTMQVCRMVDDRPRTLPTKIIDAIRALQLNQLQSKKQTIETYLNIAPYGGNLRGVEAASRAYFGKSARDLSLGEAALLAGLPQSPVRYRPDTHPDRAEWRRNMVLWRMEQLGMITPEQRQLAREEPVKILKRSNPQLAMQAAWMARGQRPAGGQTTIDLELQQEVERLASKHLEGVCRGANLAVVVIDVPTGDILALLGSADMRDPVDGQVNGVTSKRSPGSALKPFVYAAAFETGRLGPESPVHDGPLERAGWAPENFDRTYLGEITAAEALRRSRNVPAILLTEAVGLTRCLGLLEAVGLELPAGAKDRGGLAVAVGALEVTLLDLVNGYATLARQGRRLRPRLFLDEQHAETGVLDANVCATINDILSSRKRLPAGFDETASADIPWFMWKTGTSSGRRDAWAVGHNGRYAVGVWAGNFSGAGHVDFVGAEAAEPLLTQLFCLPSLKQIQTPPSPKVWVVDRPLPQAPVASSPFKILSPAEGDTYLRRGNQAVVHPRANAPADCRWFLNGLLLGATCPTELALDPGSFELRCVDNTGAAASVSFNVE